MRRSSRFNRQKLEQVIEEKGVRKKWIAEQMSIHPQTLYSYLNGNKVPSAHMLRLMALVLGVPEDELKAS